MLEHIFYLLYLIMIKVLIVGYGFMGKTHAMVYEETPLTVLAARYNFSYSLADKSPELSMFPSQPRTSYHLRETHGLLVKKPKN